MASSWVRFPLNGDRRGRQMLSRTARRRGSPVTLFQNESVRLQIRPPAWKARRMEGEFSVHTTKNMVDIREDHVQKTFKNVRTGRVRFRREVEALRRLAGV